MSRVPTLLGSGRGAQIGAVALAGIAQAAATAVAAFATRDLFAALHAEEAAPLAALALLLAGGTVVALARVIERTVAEWLGHGYASTLRGALYRHLSGMSASDVASRRSGALGLRFVGDLTAARDWVGLGLTRLLSSLFVIPGAALALWMLNPALASAALPPLALSLLIMAVASPFVQRLHRRLRARRARIAISMMERVVVAPELDLMDRTPKELARLRRDGEELRSRATARRLLSTTLRAIPELGAAAAGAALIWQALLLGAPAAEVAGMLAVLAILVVPLRELGGVWDRRCAWRVAREKCEKVFAIPLVRARTARRMPDESRALPLTLRGLSCVGHNRPIELTIGAGERVFLSGDSGAGKSTLLRTIAGLDAPVSGKVVHGNGTKVPSVVFVSPRSPILQGSLRRALTLGLAPRPDDEDIAHAARRFGLAAPLERPDGLDSRVGEGGRTLSDGERLRLHLARASLARPQLLVLDLSDTVDSGLWTVVGRLLGDVDATVLLGADPEPLRTSADRRLRLTGDGIVSLCARRASPCGTDTVTAKRAPLPPTRSAA